MKLYIVKTTIRGTKKVLLALANNKKEAKNIFSNDNFFIDVLDEKPNILDFHDGYGGSDFNIGTVLPKNETDYVQRYGVSNLPN